MKDRTEIREMVVDYLTRGFQPYEIRNMLRSATTDRHSVARIVTEERIKMNIRRPETSPYIPPVVDVSGLVKLAPGHYADAHSAELIKRAQKQ